HIRQPHLALILALAPFPLAQAEPADGGATPFQLAARATPATTLQADTNGILTLDDITLLLDYRSAGRSTTQNTPGAIRPHSGYPRTADSTAPDWQLRATFNTKTSPTPFVLNQTLTRLAPDTLRLSLTLAPETANTADTPPTPGALRWFVRLPETTFAGRTIELLPSPPPTSRTSAAPPKRIQLPDTPPTAFALGNARATTLHIPLTNHTLTISAPDTTAPLRILVADNRHYGQPHYTLIIEASPPPPAPNAPHTLTCDITLRPHRFTPIDLRSAANMAFADEVAGDQTGGWTDEGKDHDLRQFPTGDQTFQNIPFHIIDPATNHNRSALIFSGLHRNYFLKTAPNLQLVNPSENVRTLHLLHAYAWDQPANQLLGTLIARHPDGTVTKIPVHAHRDATNWTSPADAPNGPIAWRGATTRFPEVGLNLSRFTLPGKPLTALDIEGSGAAVWMIAAITASPDDIPPSTNTTTQKPLILAAGPDWQPIHFAHDPLPGSALDFSHLIDAPAGKHGPVIITPDGHFAFENQPTRRIRFWGTNLNFATNYIDRPLADRLATRLARMSYNAVRIHHFDTILLKTNPASSHDIDPEKLDRLDYLVSRLKAAGLYINIDLYSSRTFQPAELPDLALSTPIKSAIKPAIPISPDARAAWQNFARQLLTHRNPHTGLTWAEDPALIGICPVNENVLSATWASNATIARNYQKRFTDWLASQQLPPPSERDRSLAFARFLHEQQETSRATLAAFLRNIGVRAPLTDINHRDYKPLTLVRDHLDYVDVHRYWDHPRFVGAQWDLPFLQLDTSAIAAAAELPRQLFPTRIIGLPYAVTEFNYAYPNRHRAESGPLFGAYAAFQDWDAAYRFSYNGGLIAHLTEPSPIMSFNTSNDPISTLADRLSALLFLRADVTPSRNLITYEIDPATAFATPDALGSHTDNLSKLGLVTALGSTVRGNTRPTNRTHLATITEPGTRSTTTTPTFEDTPRLHQQLLDARILSPKNFTSDPKPDAGRYRSDTGELDLNISDARFSVITPRTEAHALARPGTVTGPILNATTDTPATLSISAIDTAPLATARRFLILHLTDVQNTGARFRTPERKILEAWGDAPLLVQRGAANITLALHPPPTAIITLHALALDGRRLHSLPVTRTADGLHFTLNTIPSPDSTHATTLAYELEIQP
ncbi:hypothetical protein, partial [Geminisphaera colitermitum]|uniref:hypothetical protein n=1 Tax=Geminisphaera colitermitum TaxID=1148786 RepID=UPI000694B626